METKIHISENYIVEIVTDILKAQGETLVVSYPFLSAKEISHYIKDTLKVHKSLLKYKKSTDFVQVVTDDHTIYFLPPEIKQRSLTFRPHNIFVDNFTQMPVDELQKVVSYSFPTEADLKLYLYTNDVSNPKLYSWLLE